MGAKGLRTARSSSGKPYSGSRLPLSDGACGTDCGTRFARYGWNSMNDDDLPSDDEARNGSRNWPHAPPHRLASAGVYFVTARCAQRRHLLNTRERRDFFQAELFKLAQKYQWTLEAWAVLSNHYHLVAHSPDDGALTLGTFLRHLHSAATKEVNRQDRTSGRSRLWQNYRETHLTLPRGYLARLNYVHNNAAHHRLVAHGWQWPWCSAKAFEAEATPAWAQTVSSFKFDRIAEEDEDNE
jgi:putative transposase